MSLLCVGTLLPAAGQVYFSETFNTGFQGGGAIPDGSLNGWSDTRTVAGAAGSWNVTDIRVTLELSGGYNGDLYAYLSFGGESAVLLNRVGVGESNGDVFGYADAGFSITLSAAGANNVHFYQDFSPGFDGSGRLTGTWRPDGRAIDPLSPPALFDSASTSQDFSRFTGFDPNGQWTLFVADVSAGGGQTTMTGWGLEIMAMPQVPEPGTITLLSLGLTVGGFVAWRRRRAVK